MMDIHPIETHPWPPEAERRLVAAAQKRPEEFIPLYDRYARSIFRYLNSRVGSPEDAEELTAQTFLEALEALPRYREQGSFAAWLFSIASRKAADYFRKRVPSALEDLEAVADGMDIPSDVAHQDEIARLKSLLRTLSPDEQEWIRLHFTAGLTFREMAVMTGKSEDAIKKAVYRLLAKLQSRLE